jgi:predicted transcriptional regulator
VGTFKFSKKKALYLIKAFPMLSNEMKKELIDKINSTKDENILEEVYRILEIGAKEIEMIVLSDEQKDSIDKGLKDFEDGNYLSNDEANRQIEEWLKK